MCTSEFPPFVEGRFAGEKAAGAHASCQQGCHGELPDIERDRLLDDCRNGNAESAFMLVTDGGIWDEAACRRGAERRIGAILAREAAGAPEDRSNEPVHNRNVPASELCRVEVRQLERESGTERVVRIDRGFRLCEPDEAPGSLLVIDRTPEREP